MSKGKIFVLLYIVIIVFPFSHFTGGWASQTHVYFYALMNGVMLKELSNDYGMAFEAVLLYIPVFVITFIMVIIFLVKALPYIYNKCYLVAFLHCVAMHVAIILSMAVSSIVFWWPIFFCSFCYYQDYCLEFCRSGRVNELIGTSLLSVPYFILVFSITSIFLCRIFTRSVRFSNQRHL